ncbi:MAG: acyltransferase [Zhenhengia sp.]|uniref:acyltransferase n=1 Tax=Zhenhengia sp. TaxID=2944208 RepID=UPI003991450B
MIKEIINILPKISIIRTLIYSIRYRGKIIIGKNAKIKIRQKGKINIQKGATLIIGVYYSLPQKMILDIYESGTLNVFGKVNLCTGSKILIGKDAELHIGDGTYINEHSRIQCRKYIEIGENCAISWGVNIMDTDEHYIISNGAKKDKYRSVKIGKHVWIGANATILKGSTIGDNCIVGANSVVNTIINSNSLIVGNPAIIKRCDVNWV